jgi:hypothetical protein
MVPTTKPENPIETIRMRYENVAVCQLCGKTVTDWRWHGGVVCTGCISSTVDRMWGRLGIKDD